MSAPPAGVTHPHTAWFDRLAEGGRMIVPITTDLGGKGLGKGIMAKITHERGRLSAQVVTFVVIYSCASVRDPRMEPLVAKALGTGTLLKLKSVRRDPHEPSDTCVLHRPEVCLSAADPTAE